MAKEDARLVDKSIGEPQVDFGLRGPVTTPVSKDPIGSKPVRVPNEEFLKNADSFERGVFFVGTSDVESKAIEDAMLKDASTLKLDLPFKGAMPVITSAFNNDVDKLYGEGNYELFDSEDSDISLTRQSILIPVPDASTVDTRSISNVKDLTIPKDTIIYTAGGTLKLEEPLLVPAGYKGSIFNLVKHDSDDHIEPLKGEFERSEIVFKAIAGRDDSLNSHLDGLPIIVETPVEVV